MSFPLFQSSYGIATDTLVIQPCTGRNVDWSQDLLHHPRSESRGCVFPACALILSTLAHAALDPQARRAWKADGLSRVFRQGVRCEGLQQSENIPKLMLFSVHRYRIDPYRGRSHIRIVQSQGEQDRVRSSFIRGHSDLPNLHHAGRFRCWRT